MEVSLFNLATTSHPHALCVGLLLSCTQMEADAFVHKWEEKQVWATASDAAAALGSSSSSNTLTLTALMGDEAHRPESIKVYAITIELQKKAKRVKHKKKKNSYL